MAWRTPSECRSTSIGTMNDSTVSIAGFEELQPRRSRAIVDLLHARTAEGPRDLPLAGREYRGRCFPDRLRVHGGWELQPKTDVHTKEEADHSLPSCSLWRFSMATFSQRARAQPHRRGL
jgi:hypothetical protein